MIATTAFNTIKHNDPRLLGTERFPIIGNALSVSEMETIMKALKGYRKHWNCFEKAKIVVEILGKGVVALGSLTVVSGDNRSTYGYMFNPPFEFHAWVQVSRDTIIDIALPGVIDKGLTSSDEYGPYLVNREPVILAGKPLPWTIYETNEVML